MSLKIPKLESDKYTAPLGLSIIECDICGKRFSSSMTWAWPFCASGIPHEKMDAKEQQRRQKVVNADQLVSPLVAVGITGQHFLRKLLAGIITMKYPGKVITSKQVTIDSVFDLSNIEMRGGTSHFSCTRTAVIIQKSNNRADILKSEAMLGEPKDAEKLIKNFIKWNPKKV